MLRRTLEATRDAASIAGTVVVTMDPLVAGIAKSHRAVGLVELAPGLNGAIEAARSVAIARGATAVLVLPADLPAISAGAIEAVIDAAAATVAAGIPSTVGLVPDRHGRGTNALLLQPPTIIDPAFGEDSRRHHEQAARRAGARYREIDGPLSLDVDTPADLVLAEATVGPLDA
jgi:2-phospho-L-lactate/phosphoenolpyruvate guanylyltransferase